jgi:DNA-binding transcriptional ArsR family regulator
MGASKLSIHTTEHIKMAQFAKVFAHPARVAILQYIASQDSCICGDIVDKVGLSQATISQHLQVIKQAGLLTGAFEGKSVCYCLNVERFKQMQLLFNSYFNVAVSNCG